MQNGKPQIIVRSPFTRSGEVLVKAKDRHAVLPDRACTHNMFQGFEVSHLTFKLTALADGAVADPQPTVLDRFVHVSALDVIRNSTIGTSLPLEAVDGRSTFRWTPKQPITMTHGHAFQIAVDARDSFDVAFNGERKRIDQIRVEVTFEGELLTYAQSPKEMFEAEAPLPG